MIAKLWSGENKLYWLLLPLSWLYGAVVWIRRQLYQRGIFQRWQAPVPVVVVGNLTVGGNGKTPLVIWLIEQLQQQGLRVGVVSRGYGSQSKQFPLLIDTNTSAAQGGDEPVLIYQRTQAPVAIAPNRCDAVKKLLDTYSLDLILTDDGLQHYALSRAMEIVVVDSQRLFGNGWWLPAGPMRERASRLNSVDWIIMNGTARTLPEALTMTLKAKQIVNLVTGEIKSLNELAPVVAIAGIGYPPRFFETVTLLGGQIASCHSFDDHHQYQYNELAMLTKDNQPLVMTEKDAVKCQAFAQSNWWYLPIDATFDDAQQAAELVQSLTRLVHHHSPNTKIGKL